jgi:hypothetical protein
MTQAVKETKALLKTTEARLAESERQVIGKAFIGLDGYRDRIIRPLKKQLKDEVQYFETIRDFSSYCSEAAGKSAQIELITQEIKLGGNAPIFAFAMSALGTPVVCLGNFGALQTVEVFEPLTKICETISLGDPAETIALEFNDGKLILSELSALKNLTWNDVKTKATISKLKSAMDSSHLIALVDWCNLNHATEIWKGIRDEIIPSLSKKERIFFFDLADPSKKPFDEIQEAMKCIAGFKPFGKVILGLNENETVKLYHAMLNQPFDMPLSSGLENICMDLFAQLDIDLLLTHPIDRCLLTSKNGTVTVPGRVVSKPKISTGGGDNLNSGFCFGLIQGLSFEESAVLGMASSGAYVQNGNSPGIKVLVDYLKVWESELK